MDNVQCSSRTAQTPILYGDNHSTYSLCSCHKTKYLVGMFGRQVPGSKADKYNVQCLDRIYALVGHTENIL